MTKMDIDALEDASRTTMVWSPEARGEGFRLGAVLSVLPTVVAALLAAMFGKLVGQPRKAV